MASRSADRAERTAPRPSPTVVAMVLRVFYSIVSPHYAIHQQKDAMVSIRAAHRLLVLLPLCGVLGLASAGQRRVGERPQSATAVQKNSVYRVVHGWPVLPEGSALDIVT